MPTSVRAARGDPGGGRRLCLGPRLPRRRRRRGSRGRWRPDDVAPFGSRRRPATSPRRHARPPPANPCGAPWRRRWPRRPWRPACPPPFATRASTGPPTTSPAGPPPASNRLSSWSPSCCLTTAWSSPSRDLVLMRGGLQPDKGIVDHLRPQLPAILRMGPQPAVGDRSAAWSEGDGGGAGVSGPESGAATAAGGHCARGRWRQSPGGCATATAYPRCSSRLRSGPVDELRVSQSRGWFEARLDCGPRRGRFQIEVTATDARRTGRAGQLPRLLRGRSPRSVRPRCLPSGPRRRTQTTPPPSCSR